MVTRRWPTEPVAGYRRETCDRCRMPFQEGYTWPGLGVPLVLCRDCTEDIEESVKSYGEDSRAAQARLLDRLRKIGA